MSFFLFIFFIMFSGWLLALTFYFGIYVFYHIKYILEFPRFMWLLKWGIFDFIWLHWNHDKLNSHYHLFIQWEEMIWCGNMNREEDDAKYRHGRNIVSGHTFYGIIFLILNLFIIFCVLWLFLYMFYFFHSYVRFLRSERIIMSWYLQ